AVMMMIRMAHLPEHLAIPVRLQNHAAFEREATEKALFRGAPVVKQRSALCEIAGQAGRVRQVQGVHDLALKVDEIDVPVLHEMRGKERKSGRGALWLTGAQPNASTFEGVLFDHRHNLIASNSRARAERG